jgi:hypothetical protein
MSMQTFVIPPAFVDRAWKEGASLLAKACDRAKDEITGDQLKLMLSRGERTLVRLSENDEAIGWAAITVEQLPNLRAFYVWSLYAPQHSLDMHKQLNRMALECGCSVIRGAVDEANERLWQRIKAEKVYSVYQIEVSV